MCHHPKQLGCQLQIEHARVRCILTSQRLRYEGVSLCHERHQSVIDGAEAFEQLEESHESFITQGVYRE
jgi:hypothetical protein